MMKKVFFVLASALVLGTASAAAQAVITFKQTTHNFGKFAEDKEQAYEFVYTNTGDKPLVIEQTVASCGCTVPTYTQEPVAPGKTGKIKVVYNGRGKFPGHFQKSISVRSNASNSLERIYIEGDMTAAPKEGDKK
jgi:hypothetical protein